MNMRLFTPVAILAALLFCLPGPGVADTPEPIEPGKTLSELEASSPKDGGDRAAIEANHARVVALIESNTLQSGSDFYRASTLLRMHLGEFRIVRMQYELLLAAAAEGDAAAAKELAATWDSLHGVIGRPCRFDFSGWAQANPVYAEYEEAPDCVRTVWRDPVAAGAASRGVADSAEIKTIRDADQADRQGNWGHRSTEEREATMNRDKARNIRMQEIVAAGDIHTAADFARAALVLQHSARFAGYRLAHELAVSSLLLGDRQTGRWLVTATYDRMLRSLGLDQRFGTQMGPAGPLRVDESGICDNQRVALGCPALAQARNRQAPGTPTTDKGTLKMIEPGHVFHDANLGVRAVYPEGWIVELASPAGAKATSVKFDIPGRPKAAFAFYYKRLDQAQPANREAAEALLRQQAAAKEADRQHQAPGYRNRPGSLTYAPANTQPAVRWMADVERDGIKWSEYLVRILGPNSVGLLFLYAPTDEIDALRPAVDAMADSVQLP